MKKISNGICASKGFIANGVNCGIRSKTKRDLTVIYSEVPCSAAAIYTQNKVKGAPILVSKTNLEDNKAQAIICNSGNANTCNADGVEIATKMCELVAKELNISSKDVIVASTGVIGQKLDINIIKSGIKPVVQGLNVNGNEDAIEGIMTTDTTKKQTAYEFTIDNKVAHIGAIAKGSGMININMATMLSFITSDVAIDGSLLKDLLKEVADGTFNMVSVDGDTSTNDTLAIMCNGLANNKKITTKDKDYETFKEVLTQCCVDVAKMLAADGEGATKLLVANVSNANSLSVARIVAKQVISSSLLKAAMFGKDANWGRILCAIGYAPADFDITKIEVHLASEFGSIQVCLNGAGVDFSEDKALEILQSKEININIDMHQGNSNATAWGCDLTYDYVKINGDYRS